MLENLAAWLSNTAHRQQFVANYVTLGNRVPTLGYCPALSKNKYTASFHNNDAMPTQPLGTQSMPKSPLSDYPKSMAVSKRNQVVKPLWRQEDFRC